MNMKRLEGKRCEATGQQIMSQQEGGWSECTLYHEKASSKVG